MPRVPDSERVSLDDLGYATTESSTSPHASDTWSGPTCPRALRAARPRETEGPIDLDNASYFLSKLELCVGDAPTMAPWRKRLFIATSHITADAAAHFDLPLDRTVIIGSRLEV